MTHIIEKGHQRGLSKMTDLQVAVLGFICSDYETSATIRREVFIVFDRSINQDDIDKTLYGLVEKGFAKAYRFNPNTRKYETVELNRIDCESWFFVTEAGLAFLEGEGSVTLDRIRKIFKERYHSCRKTVKAQSHSESAD